MNKSAGNCLADSMPETTPVEAEAARRRYRATGDEDAKWIVVMYVYRKYIKRTAKYRSLDPMWSQEDIEAAFLEGLIRGVERDADKGDSMYYIGQSGIWYVKSKLRRDGGKPKVQINEIHRVPEMEQNLPDADAALGYERVENATYAKQVVDSLVKTGSFTHRQMDLIALIMDDKIDFHQMGANKKAAELLGISQQRVSALRNRMAEMVQAA